MTSPREGLQIISSPIRLGGAGTRRLLRSSGIDWRTETTPSAWGATDVAVVIFPARLAKKSENVMGFIASLETMRAIVISDYVSNFARQMNTSVGPIFGAVIAHEIGHLLRERWSSDDVVDLLRGRLAFHPEQAAAIRREVARRLNAGAREPSAVMEDQGLEGSAVASAVAVQGGSVSVSR